MNNFQRRKVAAGRREKKARATRARVLITTDGHTEHDYLDGFLTHHRLRPAVELTPYFGVDVLTLVQKTMRGAGKVISSTNFISAYEEIWIVCDTENKAEATGSRRLPDARAFVASIRPKKPQLVLSCPCVEVWFLFHVGGVGPLMNGTEAKKKMVEILPGYDTAGKGRVDYVVDLLPSEDAAIARAKGHFASVATGNPLNNPATEMWRLVERLYGVAVKPEKGNS